MKRNVGQLPRFMSITDGSTCFGVSRYQIRKWIKSGRLRSTFVGNRFLVETEDLEALIYAGVSSKKNGGE